MGFFPAQFLIQEVNCDGQKEIFKLSEQSRRQYRKAHIIEIINLNKNYSDSMCSKYHFLYSQQ